MSSTGKLLATIASYSFVQVCHFEFTADYTLPLLQNTTRALQLELVLYHFWKSISARDFLKEMMKASKSFTWVMILFSHLEM